MSYYDNQQSKVNIYYGLVERGWKCYGFKPDESDSMTDYWSPAHWDGIAEKDGYILLVDVYGTHSSGYQKKERTFTADYSKIKKLETLRDDKAATEGEKQACQIQIDKLLQKEKESTIIVEQYPTWKHGNPKRNNWHIEKDGEIIAKGNGAFQCDGYLFGNYEKETMEKVNKFLDRVESFINGNDQLEKVITKQVKKVIKPIEVTDRKTIEVGDVLKFDYHGHVWEVISITTRNDGKITATYELLGSEKRGCQKKKNGKRYYDYMNRLEKNIEEGKIKIYKLQEVEEVTEKVTYKKTTRKRKAQDENLLQGETIQETENTVKNENEESEYTQETQQEQNNLNITYKINEEKNGVEIYFTDKPDEEIRNKMKSLGFRWGKYNRCWYAKQSEETISLAQQLAGEQSKNTNNSTLTETPEGTQETVFTYPEIEINDLDSYVINQQLQDREHDSHWVMRTKKKDHNKEIQDYFQSLNNEVMSIIETTDNEYFIYKLKKTLQYYKKHYFNNYVKRLEHGANNPSWVTTGRDGRNASKDQKAFNRLDKLMREYIELDKDYKKRIENLKTKIRREKENKLKQQIENTNVSIEFKTETKEFTYMGIKEKKRCYVYGDYYICKLWACFRIFKNGKEVHSMKTTENLEQAKKYVTMKVLDDQQQKSA